MIITHHRERLINAIIYFAKHTEYCGRTKLMKLLYYLDFTNFKLTGRSVTGMDYFAWDFGPVPRKLWHEVDKGMDKDLKGAVSKVKRPALEDGTEVGGATFTEKKGHKFNEDYFSDRELQILSDLSEIFKEATAKQMVDSTHMNDTPWSETWKDGEGSGDKIDYMLAIGKKVGGLNADQANNRYEEITEMYRNLGVV